MRRPLVLMSLAWVGTYATAAAAQNAPPWVGRGRYRILVEVPPRDLGPRSEDEMPARLHLSAQNIGARIGAEGKIDVGSVQIGRYDPASGKPVNYGKWKYAGEGWEVPFRWYDDSIPEDFPEVVGNLDPQTGELKFFPQRNWGYFYETLGEWDGGQLAWIHTQRGKDASYYAIYFDLLALDERPEALPRTGFVGDGTERIEETAPSTHGLILSRVEAADWNGDALVDIFVGAQRGGIVWYPNRGTREAPRFPYPKLLFTADGQPLDVGFSATPLVIDWDGDGDPDLVCGAEWNRAVWYRNTGTSAAPRLEYKGLVYADGKPLELPIEPVPEIREIYQSDYHPVLAAADINGDGRPDILAGGYVTGRIYLFENTGAGPDHTPALRFRGPLEADGEPLDVGWAAAPAAADVDDDGLLDIITGSMPMTAEGGDSASRESFLCLFKNVGTKTEPRFARRKFPLRGEFPVSSLAAPRLVDLTGDGLLDLVVARDANLSIYLNIGTKRSPLWEYAPPLRGAWHTAPLLGWTSQLADWDGDGHFDIVQGFSARLNLKQGNPQFFGESRSIIGPGDRIFHKSPVGDQWTFTHVADMDGDGRRDILYGVHEGWIYLHRSLSTTGEVRFDGPGVRLNTEDDNPLKVGPKSDQKWDFDVLQGARTTLAAADFDGDGQMDLVVGDTYGVLRYYRNLTGGPDPRFARPEVAADLRMRLVPSIADWNADGWPDVVLGSSRAFIVMNTGRPDGERFLPARPIRVPGADARGGVTLEQIPGSPQWQLVESREATGLYLPYESVVTAVDWNEDGDDDLLAIASYGYLCWFERSFLDHGYAAVNVTKVEVR